MTQPARSNSRAARPKNLNIRLHEEPQHAVEVHRAFALRVQPGRTARIGVFLPALATNYDITIRFESVSGPSDLLGCVTI